MSLFFVLSLMVVIGLAAQPPSRNDEAYFREWKRQAIEAGAYKEPKTPRDPPGTWTVFFIWVVLLALAIIAGHYGY